jgi:hypothetical protein
VILPEWVPEELRYLWQRLWPEGFTPRNEEEERTHKVRLRLVTHPRMKWVWSEITKQRRLNPDREPNISLDSQVFIA